MAQMVGGGHQTDVKRAVSVYKKFFEGLKNDGKTGTRKISMSIAAGEQLSDVKDMLITKCIEATNNMSDSSDRTSALNVIRSALKKLMRFAHLPTNGLVFFSGTFVENVKYLNGTEEREYTYQWQPYKPITKSLYYCDNEFHSEVLDELITGHDVLMSSIQRDLVELQLDGSNLQLDGSN